MSWQDKTLTIAGKSIGRKRVISVWLVSDDNWKLYHCPDCRNAMFQYKGDIAAEVPGGSECKIPVKIQCKNRNCGRKVQINAASEQED